MEAKGKNTLQKLTLVLLAILFVLPCITYAAPATTQKGTQQVTPAGGAASSLLNPNAPPQGTITINASSKGNLNASTWVTGSYQFIQWTCNGTRSNLVDVTLWQNNSKVVVIGTGITTGQTAYAVPTAMAIGSYELRITCEEDTRVEARQAVTVVLPSIKITAPKANEQLYYGSQYTITWTYAGDPGPINLSICQPEGNKCVIYFPKWLGDLSPVSAAMGQGSAVWTIPTQPILGASFGMPFVITVNSKSNPAISASSGAFVVVCRYSSCVSPNSQEPGSVCADLQTDSKNCGWCRHMCLGVPCAKGQCICPPENPNLCRFKGTVPTYYKGQADSSKTIDYDICVNFQNDQVNCGSCGHECPASTPACKGGTCTTW